MSSSTNQAYRWAERALVFSGLLSFSAALLILVLSADRGLEWTDEASYLLIAQNPWKTWGHGTLFGFGLYPIWHLAGEKIFYFRLAGFFLTVLAGGVLCASTLKFFQKQTWLLPLPLKLGLGAAVVTSCLGIFSDGIRTPSYNWMSWLGAVLFLAAILQAWGPGKISLPWSAVGACGWAILFLGKWGAALGMLVLVFLSSVWAPRAIRQSVLQNLLRVVLLAFAGVLVLLFGWIGPEGIQNTLWAGVLISQKTGSHGFWLLPKYVYEIFYYGYRLVRAFTWIIPLGLLLWWAWKKTQKTPPPLTVFCPLLFFLATVLAFLRGYGIGGTLAFSKESLICGGWFLGVLWVAWRFHGSFRAIGVPWALIGIMLATPWILGLGTNTSIADFSGHTTVLVTVAGWILLAVCYPQLHALGVLVVAMSLISVQATRVVTSLWHSYQIGSVWKESELLESGPEKGKLRLRPESRKFFVALDQTLEANGFQQGSPVVGLSDICGIVYLAGGRSPGVPWYFGQHPQHNPYAQAVLALLPPDELSKIWLFRSPGTKLTNDLHKLWPMDSKANVPQWVASVPNMPADVQGLPADPRAQSLEIYRPSP